MISLKQIFKVRNLATTLLMLVLAINVQGQDENNDEALNKRLSTSSGGWVSGVFIPATLLWAKTV